MRRAALFVLVGLTTLLAAQSARADCADEVRVARKEVAGVKDESHRRELSLLLDKAEKDAKAGREQLCRDAMARVPALTH